MTDWLDRLFETIDRMDADGFVAFLAEGVCFRFGSAPAATGKADVRRAIVGFFATIRGLHHRVTAVWEQPDVVICEGEVTYTLEDDRRVSVPFLNVMRMTGQVVCDYRIYIDPTPMAAQGSPREYPGPSDA